MTKPLSEMTREELWQLFPIILMEYDPVWKTWYEEENRAIIAALGDAISRVNHIGSTSVEGLTAKPTVDILLELHPDTELQPVIERLVALGWRWLNRPTAGADSDIAYLNKGYTENGFAERVFHLHVRRPGDWDELYFRDYLREHPSACDEYGKLKRSLMVQFKHNRDAYTTQKTGFVQQHTRLARQLFGGRYLPKE